MSEIQVQQPHPQDDEISLKELILKIKEWVIYLKTKWVIILSFGIIGAGIGYVYAYFQKPIYTATLTFALEDEKSGGSGLAGAMGLASSLGIDLGTSAGGAFSGSNLVELMKSRRMVEKALLNPIVIFNKQQSLASYYIEFNELNKNWYKYLNLKNIKFVPFSNRSNFSLQQDSIMGVLYKAIAGPDGLLKVSQKDKKISIINIEVRTKNELFSKIFAESIAKEVSEFYVESKSKKARMNVAILQKQADSIRNELNDAILGVASSNDNIFNLNPAQNVKRTPSSKRQIDVQANTAILTQLVTNLEMAKVTLLKETPLIQVIDLPILPLKKEEKSKLVYFIIGGFLVCFFTICLLFVKQLLYKMLHD